MRTVSLVAPRLAALLAVADECGSPDNLIVPTTLLEELESAGGKWKAEIWRCEDSTLRVRLRRYVYEAVPEHDHFGGFWVEVPTSVSITDSIDIARSIASDLLAQHAADNE